MGTGESLTAPEGVQRLQTALHAKAKEAPGLRFYSLSDKVWRDDVLAVAWQAVRRNGGAAGVDGETVADVESFGVGRWLGVLARDLKEGTYRPQAVRQVLIPKKQRGKFRPLGIPVPADVVYAIARWRRGIGMDAQRGDEGTQPSGVQLGTPVLGPLLGQVGAGAVDGLATSHECCLAR